MPKTPNSSRKLKKPANLVPGTKPVKWLEDYRERLTWALKPLTDHSLEHLCKDYIEYVSKPETILLDTFFVERGINPQLRKRWSQRYPEFKEVDDWARAIIGERRERNAYHDAPSGPMVVTMMPFYNEDWKEMTEWRNKLKADAESNNKANVIVLSELEYKKQETL